MSIRIALMTVAALFHATGVSAQRRLDDVAGRGALSVTFDDMQRASLSWMTSHAGSDDKWYLRWEAFNAQRVSPDGSLASARTYWASAKQTSAAKLTMMKSLSGSGWAPVGPMTLATSDDPTWVTGIGRINCVAFHPTDPNTLWVGVAQGGVWKTVDGGASWRPLTDDLPILRISDIAVDPVDPDVMYISVGDFAYIGIDLVHADRKRHSHFGLGVYKTIDGGETWNETGLSFELDDYDGSLIRRVFIHPDDRSRLLAAGTSGMWSSTDGGETWAHGLDKLIWDIERAPNDPNVLYASTGRLRLFGIGSASIRKSTDFGASWVPLAAQIPGDEAQRIEIAISRSDPNYVYAVASSNDVTFQSFVRSTDAGLTWTVRSENTQGRNILGSYDGGEDDTRGQGNYDLAIIVDPNSRDRVFVGGINVWGTEDGGASWDGVSHWQGQFGPSIHADHHQFANNPLNGRYYFCNDGGINTADSIIIGSWEAATSGASYTWPTQWTNISGGMAITSFYRVGLSRDNPGYVVAGAQDNATFYFDGSAWAHMFGGDGMDCFIDNVDPRSVYGSSQYGYLRMSAAGGPSDRFLNLSILREESGEWTTPFSMHPTSSTLYAGFGNVWRTSGPDSAWTKISSFNSIQGPNYPTPISAMSVSSFDERYIYLGKRIWHFLNLPTEAWMTPDGGASWRDITAGLPDSLYLTAIATHATDVNTAWATFGGFTDGLKVYRTTDAGATWTNISRNLPNLPVNAIVHDFARGANDVYIGTDIGVYRTNDEMGGWIPFSDNLPNVVVSDLEIHRATGKLYAATFGRGVWITDLTSLTGRTEDSRIALNTLGARALQTPRHGAIILETTSHEELRGAHVAVIDVLGRQVAERRVTIGAGVERHELELGLRSGLYFVRLSHPQVASRVVRVAIEH